jgi:hypothetical protein
MARHAKTASKKARKVDGDEKNVSSAKRRSITKYTQTNLFRFARVSA